MKTASTIRMQLRSCSEGFPQSPKVSHRAAAAWADWLSERAREVRSSLRVNLEASCAAANDPMQAYMRR